MTKYNGGYIMLDLSASNVYEQATACLTAGKAIQIIDGNKVYFATFIAIDDDTKTITVTATNTSITITTAGVVTATDTTPHLYEVTFNVSDDYLSFLSTTNVGDYTIEDTASLTDDDKAFITSLKGKLSTTSSVGTDGGAVGYLGGLNNGTNLILQCNGAIYTFNFDTPVNETDSDTMTITTKQLF